MGDRSRLLEGVSRTAGRPRLAPLPRDVQTKNAELEGHLGALRTQAEEKDGLLAAAAEELSRSGGEERGEAGWKAAHKLSERVTELSASEAALRTEVASLRALLGGGGRGEVLREANAGAREREKGKEEEDAIAGLHARLLEEMKERRAAEGRAKEAEREARMERERLEAEARRARVEGALRIKSLEETVQVGPISAP